MIKDSYLPDSVNYRTFLKSFFLFLVISLNLNLVGCTNVVSNPNETIVDKYKISDLSMGGGGKYTYRDDPTTIFYEKNKDGTIRNIRCINYKEGSLRYFVGRVWNCNFL